MEFVRVRSILFSYQNVKFTKIIAAMSIYSYKRDNR